MTGRYLLAASLAAALTAGCAAVDGRDVLYQTSTIGALQEGVYDGEVALAELLRHGDTGIGTFDALDGEMVVLDGRVYQVRADGKVCTPGAGAKTPFAAVTFFDVDSALPLDGPLELDRLEVALDRAIDAAPGGGRNLPVAVRVTGTFRHVKVRSVPRQQPPYKRLAEVTARQPVFELRDVAGTLVGFRLPELVRGINVPGWHLHFLTADRTAGGHVLEATAEKASAELDVTPDLFVELPRGGGFGRADLSKDRAEELKKVER